jgi:hypothetical protein
VGQIRTHVGHAAGDDDAGLARQRETPAVGRLPTTVNCAFGTASRTAGKIRSANQVAASTFGQ